MLRMGRLKVFVPPSSYRRPHLPKHSPQVWPWWRLVSVAVVQVRPSGVRFNKNVWIYTRGRAWCLQVVYDTRVFP